MECDNGFDRCSNWKKLGGKNNGGCPNHGSHWVNHFFFKDEGNPIKLHYPLLQC